MEVNKHYFWFLFINYHIHRSISGNKQSRNSSGDSGDVITVIGVALLLFQLLCMRNTEWFDRTERCLLYVKIKYSTITNEANVEEVVCNATEISGIEGEF